MHSNTLHKTAILVKLGHILWRKCSLSLWCPSTPLPQLCDSRRFLKATCRLPEDWSCSCSSSSRYLWGTALLNKRLQTERAVIEQGEPEDPLLLKLLFCASLCFVFEATGPGQVTYCRFKGELLCFSFASLRGIFRGTLRDGPWSPLLFFAAFVCFLAGSVLRPLGRPWCARRTGSLRGWRQGSWSLYPICFAPLAALSLPIIKRWGFCEGQGGYEQKMSWASHGAP